MGDQLFMASFTAVTATADITKKNFVDDAKEKKDKVKELTLKCI